MIVIINNRFLNIWFIQIFYIWPRNVEPRETWDLRHFHLSPHPWFVPTYIHNILYCLYVVPSVCFCRPTSEAYYTPVTDDRFSVHYLRINVIARAFGLFANVGFAIVHFLQLDPNTLDITNIMFCNFLFYFDIYWLLIKLYEI